VSTKALASDHLSIADEKLRTSLSRLVPPAWKHQTETLELARRTPRLFDTSDPGTGKTRAHIDVAVERLAAGEITSVLVLCPKTLMASAWAADISTFAPNLVYSLAYAENREEAFAPGAHVYITNIDAVKWLDSKTPGWRKKVFGKSPMIIIDESTAFKRHTSDRSAAVRRIIKTFPYRTLMTGTPITTSVVDIWHQMKLLDDGKRLGTSYVAFRNAVQEAIPNGDRTKWQDKEGSEEVIAYLIRDLSVRHRFDEVMDVPPNYSRNIFFQLSKRARAAYDEFERHAYLELENGAVDAINAAVLQGKLFQIASGIVYGADKQELLIDTNRHELALELIAARDHSVVFFNWQHQRNELVQQAKKRGIEHAYIDGSVSHKKRTGIVEDFQAGNLAVLFLHPQTGAHGLTLTRGRTTIWTSPRFEPDFLKQGLHRVYRGGQKHKTENINICAEDTVDKYAYGRQEVRYARMNNLLDLIKERRNDSA
jgi:SNF2 family DNA or RNA helicase